MCLFYSESHTYSKYDQQIYVPLPDMSGSESHHYAVHGPRASLQSKQAEGIARET